MKGVTSRRLFIQKLARLLRLRVYAVRLSELAITSRSLVRDLDPKNDLTFLRVTCKVHDMMIAPDRDYFLIGV